MSVNLSPLGGVAGQFLDNNGVILSGGKIYTYAAGTTTPQATYTSATGTSAHTNPIILDSAGRVPSGEIWLTDGLQYKFVIKTSDDVLIGTYDNIIGINSNFVNYAVQEEIQTATAGQTVFTLSTVTYTPNTNTLQVFVDGVNQYDGVSYAYVETDSTTVTFTAGLHVGALVKFTTAITMSAGVTDAALVTYDPPFVGSVATNVEDKLAQTVSVKDFGAVGDGVTDDTAAIQAAIDSGAKEVFFPQGTYNVSTTLTVSARMSLVGSTASGRGSQQATLVWTGANSSTMFDVGVGSTVLGVTFHGLTISTSATGMLLIDGTGTFNMVVEQCSFSTTTYTKAIKLSETGAGNDGAFWTRIRENTFTNCYIEVLDDSNATFISDNDFYADLVSMAGPSLMIDGNVTINAVMIDGNTFEGTYDAATYAVSITNVVMFSFTNNRIENSTGGSLYLGTNFDANLLSGNFFNTPYVVGGSRATSAHGSGQSYTDIGNRFGPTATIRTAEIAKLGATVAGENVLLNGHPSIDWYFGNCTGTSIQDGSTGLRCPVMRLHTPTAGSAQGNPTQVLRNTPEMQLAIQNEDFVTAVFIVKAKSTNTATSVVQLETGDADEYWTIPKDDKWHVIRVPRRLKSTDTTIQPTVWLAYASSYNAADEVWIGGIGLYLGTGATELPFFDGWTTDPATAGNTSYFQRGDVARSVNATTGAPAGWMCTVKGNPGTWKPLANLS